MIVPRDYQEYAVDGIFRYFEEGGVGNPIVAMPTGTGKSLVIAWFIAEVFRRYQHQRIMVLTHVKELIAQNYSKLMEVWPSAPAGIYSAGLGRRDYFAPVVFAGIASAAGEEASFGHVDLVMIDECHLVSPKEGTMYQTFIAKLREVNPKLKVIGLTATHYRLGQGPLTEEGSVFTDVCVDMTTLGSFNWFLDEGYLCPLVPRPTRTTLNVEDVKVQHGEFNQRQLQDTVDREEITQAALAEVLELASDRAHWLVFASGVEHAEHTSNMLNAFGVESTFIHSKMRDHVRDERLADYKAGRYRAMVNNGILTTGFDFPAMDLIVMLRPTMSPGLWVQMLGRGTRPLYAPGYDLLTRDGRLAAIAASQKRNCLVLDFAGNTKRLGPINDPVMPRKRGKGTGEAPVKLCGGCGCYCHTSQRFCKFCGYQFPQQVKVTAEAGSEELIKRSDAPEIVDMPVTHMTYAEHRKPGRPPSLKVSYHCGLRTFHEWVCLEHEGYPGKRARDWWREHSTNTRPPERIIDAFRRLNELRTPRSILVWLNKEHPEVRGHVFS